MSTNVPQITLIFTDADPAQPDPAAVGATARTTVGALRAAGATITPDYTGTKGAAEVLLWVVAASTATQSLMALPDFALKVAQLLSEIRKLRGAEPAAPPPPPITVVVRVEGASATISSAAAPDADALLAQLLAEGLPKHIRPDATTITVQVPPTPPNEI